MAKCFLRSTSFSIKRNDPLSTLDRAFPESSLLFPSRSSPIVCAVDALNVIHEFLVYIIVHDRGMQDAALRTNWRRARYRLGSDIKTLQENITEKRPNTVLILFIGTVLQVLGLFAADSIFWTKMWAGIYLSSYVPLAIVGLLAPSGWRENPPEELEAELHVEYPDRLFDEITLFLSGFSLILHAFISCWAVYQAVHWNFWQAEQGNITLFLFNVLVLLVFFSIQGCWIVPLILAAVVIVIQGVEICVWRNASLRSRLFRLGEIVVCLPFIAIMVLGPLKPFSPIGFAEVIVHGGGVILLSFACSSYMIRMLINLLDKMSLLGSSEDVSTRKIFFTMFAFANFIIALLYYGIRFNSSGTLRGRTPWVDRKEL